MTGRWPCVVLVLVLAACRTPQKNVSVYPLADDAGGTARHLQAGSDVGETVTGRMNLPNYADTETATNSLVATPPIAASSPPATTSPATAELPASVKLTATPAVQEELIHRQPGGLLPPTNARAGLGDRTASHRPAPANRPLSANVTLPGQTGCNSAGAQTETVHLLPGSLLPAPPTNTAAHLDISSRRSLPGGAPVSQPIHLNLAGWTNSAARELASSADIAVGHARSDAQRQSSASVTVPVTGAGNSAAGPGAAPAVPLPAVGTAAPTAAEVLSKPVDLEPLLDGGHDEAWRQRQADQQHAAESARQSERDSLEKTLQQFLQPHAK